MGSSNRSDEEVARTGIVAQRLAQGIRNYLAGLLVEQGPELNGIYEATTQDGITSISCEFKCADNIPFKIVNFTIEFEHR